MKKFKTIVKKEEVKVVPKKVKKEKVVEEKVVELDDGGNDFYLE